MPRIVTDAVELNYDLVGNGETTVLAHGGWSDRNNWQTVVHELSRSFRVVTYDRRGHGLSTRDVEGTRRDQEDDLAALIDALGDGPANIVGTSFGGSIGIGLASRRPELVRSVVVHEPPLISLVAGDPAVQPQLEAVQSSIQGVLERLANGDATNAARKFVEEVAFQPGAWEQLPQPLRDTMVDTAPALLAEQKDPLWALVDPEALAGIACPVLITQGDESPGWFRSIVAKLADTIEDAEVHTYRGAGHAPHVSHPRDYLATVTRFLSPVPVP